MISPSLPAGYTRESGYPRGQRSDGVDSVVDKMHASAATFTLADLDGMESLVIGALVVNDISWESNPNQQRVFVTIRYGEPTWGGYSPLQSGVEQWTLDDSGQEIPIDKRKADGSLWFTNYKTNHNYKLIAKAGKTVPAWWATATDTENSDEDYRWVKESDSIPEGWIELEDKTKNIESVINPSPVVVGTTKYKSYSKAVNKKKVVGTKATPDKTFDLTGEFLVVASSVSPDGKRWVVETRYQEAKEWDSDYYDEEA